MTYLILGGIALAVVIAFFAFKGGEKKADKKVKKAEREIPERVAERVVEKIGASPARPLSPTGGTAPAPVPAPTPAPDVTSTAPEPASDEFGFWVENEKIEIIPFHAYEVRPQVVKRGTTDEIDVRLVVPPFSKESREKLLDILMRPSNPSIYDGGAELFAAIKKVGALPADVPRLGSTQVQFIEELEYRLVRGELPGNDPIRLHRPDSSAHYLRFHLTFPGSGPTEIALRLPIRVLDVDDEYGEVIEGFLAGPMPNAGYVGNRGLKYNFRIPLEVA